MSIISLTLILCYTEITSAQGLGSKVDVAIDYDNSNQTLAGKVCGETQIKTQLRALFVTSPEVILLNMTSLFTLSHQLYLSQSLRPFLFHTEFPKGLWLRVFSPFFLKT